jgi:hypothetical protein
MHTIILAIAMLVGLAWGIGIAVQFAPFALAGCGHGGGC